MLFKLVVRVDLLDTCECPVLIPTAKFLTLLWLMTVNLRAQLRNFKNILTFHSFNFSHLHLVDHLHALILIEFNIE